MSRHRKIWLLAALLLVLGIAAVEVYRYAIVGREVLYVGMTQQEVERAFSRQMKLYTYVGPPGHIKKMEDMPYPASGIYCRQLPAGQFQFGHFDFDVEDRLVKWELYPVKHQRPAWLDRVLKPLGW